MICFEEISHSAHDIFGIALLVILIMIGIISIYLFFKEENRKRLETQELLLKTKEVMREYYKNKNLSNRTT